MVIFKKGITFKSLYRYLKLQLGIMSEIESDVYELLVEYCGKTIADKIWDYHKKDVLEGFTMPSTAIFGLDLFTEYLDIIVDRKPDNALSRVMYPDYEPNEHGYLVKLNSNWNNGKE